MSSAPRQRKSAASAEALIELERLVHASSADEHALSQAARHPALTEELALALFARRDLPFTIPGELAQNGRVLKHRKVRLALVTHPRTPRHVSLPQLRHLFVFDLMQVALTPSVAADLKIAAEELLAARVKTLFAGERFTLARRASARVAAELLLDTDARIVAAALDNSRLTESFVVKALAHPHPSQELVHQVCDHAKWSTRREIRMALLRNPHTPLSAAIAFTDGFSADYLADILSRSALPENVRFYLQRVNARRREKS
jgi:hypothetical protein